MDQRIVAKLRRLRLALALSLDEFHLRGVFKTSGGAGRM